MMKSFSVRNSSINHQISVLERQRSRMKFQEEEHLNEGGESFTYFIGNDDFSGYPLLENQWNDEFGSQFEVGYPLQRTASCPPDVVAREGNEAAGREGRRKRKGDYLKAKMEEKKIKGCEEDESRVTEQNSNCKSTTTNAAGSTGSAAGAGKRGNVKASDAPKSDYIHVRARRGQATDSHSLAERVRREKISERMRYLQDLVPGCDKITGKAGMLDEIINYVQSLQKQVEFLSMKLAAVNPRFEFDMESYPSKEIYPPCTSSFPTIGASSIMDPLLSHGIPGLVLDTNTNAAGAILRRIMSAPPVTIPDTSFDSSTWDIQHLNWEDELQNLVAMDCQQGRESIFAGNVKMEM